MTSLTVNGEAIRYRFDPATPLLWALREASNLTGTKYGCGTGDCGACIVDIDGRAAPACLTPLAGLEGSSVTTIEGLSRDKSHPVQQAWLAEQVSQCGFCVPGMIMATVALLRANTRPTDADIDRTITNICRCGTYNRARRAIHRAAEMIAAGGG